MPGSKLGSRVRGGAQVRITVARSRAEVPPVHDGSVGVGLKVKVAAGVKS